MSAAGPLPRVNPESLVIDTVRRAATRQFQHGLRAIVLTGSVARGEGTWLREPQSLRLAGDAEFFLVFDGGALPTSESVAALRQQIEEELQLNSIAAKIGLSPVHPTYFQRLRPHIFAHELRTHGQVIHGDRRILELIPSFDASAIPREDGFCLLMNRVIELIEALAGGLGTANSLPERVRHAAAKLWLDMATSYLLFEGGYASTYRERQMRLVTCLAANSNSPISAARFIERVTIATQWKLGVRPGMPVETCNDLLEQIADVRALWRWELQRMGARDDAGSDRALLGSWIRQQPVGFRLRGWVSLIKRLGLGASLTELPRWVTAGCPGSPRQRIYTAASVYLFELPSSVSCDELDTSPEVLQPLCRLLPVRRTDQQVASWRAIGTSLVWHYHQFLEDTRA